MNYGKEAYGYSWNMIRILDKMTKMNHSKDFK